MIGGAEVGPVKTELVLVQNGCSDRAMNWLKRDRKELYGRDDEGVGKHGVLAGVPAVYEKWSLTSLPTRGTRASGRTRGKGHDWQNRYTKRRGDFGKAGISGD